MAVSKQLIALTVVLSSGRVIGSSVTVSSPTVYSGVCSASAAVALSERLFVVANDEDNVLRIYDNNKPGPPVESLDVSAFLQVDRKSPETDLEAAARTGAERGRAQRSEEGHARTTDQTQAIAGPELAAKVFSSFPGEARYRGLAGYWTSSYLSDRPLQTEVFGGVRAFLRELS